MLLLSTYIFIYAAFCYWFWKKNFYPPVFSLFSTNWMFLSIKIEKKNWRKNVRRSLARSLARLSPFFLGNYWTDLAEIFSISFFLLHVLQVRRWGMSPLPFYPFPCKFSEFSDFFVFCISQWVLKIFAWNFGFMGLVPNAKNYIPGNFFWSPPIQELPYKSQGL